MEFGTQSSTDAPGQMGVWPVLEGVAYAGRWGVGRGNTGK